MKDQFGHIKPMWKLFIDRFRCRKGIQRRSNTWVICLKIWWLFCEPEATISIAALRKTTDDEGGCGGYGWDLSVDSIVGRYGGNLYGVACGVLKVDGI